MLNNIDFDIVVLISAGLIVLALLVDAWLVIRYLYKRKRGFELVLTSKLTLRSISKDGHQISVPAQQNVASGLAVPEEGKSWRRRAASWWRRIRFLLLNIVLVVAAVWLLAAKMQELPVIQSSSPAQDAYWQDFTRPIEVNFNVPVRISSLRPFLSNEQLQGNWEYERYLGLPVTRHARFYPTNTVMPEQRLVVYMTGVSRPKVDEYHERALEFFTPRLPEVYSISPMHNSTEVDTHTQVDFELTRDVQPFAKLVAKVEPEVPFDLNIDKAIATLRFGQDLQQGQTYTVTLWRTAQTYRLADTQVLEQDNPVLVHSLNFTTIKAPLIKKFTPTGSGVKIDSPVFIKFDVAVDQQQVEHNLQIMPATLVEFVWIDERTVRVVPTQPLPKETEYTFVLPAGIQSQNGAISDQEARYTFTTVGAVRVKSFSPTDGSVRVSRHNQVVSVEFDQEVDQTSAQSKFSISPTIGGSFSWDGNVMKYTPSSSLAFGTYYTITIAAGVKTVYGLDSRDVFSAGFTTVPQQTIIPGLSLIYQTQNMTCNVTSTRMILAYRGFAVSDSEVISRAGQDLRTYHCDADGGPCYWGNPHEEYVGYPNGHGGGNNQAGDHPGKGYGIYWEVAQDVLAQYGISSRLYRNWNTAGLASEIAAGHPVILWWYNGVSGGERIDWYDFDTHEQIYAINGMHSIVIIGFNGDVGNPDSFIVLDPWWGNQTYSKAKFDWQWPYFQNTGVAIY